RDALPFVLTPDQEAAIAELDRDLAQAVPMQRLLQGDVGSGKTVVALYALLRAVEAGRQGALMAPTQTLAEQHFLTVEAICSELGVNGALMTRSVRGSAEASIVVGTHARIQDGVEVPNLAAAVADEQHRVGVEQRRASRAAEEEAERLRRAELAGYRVGLLHGRLKAAERREVMRAFKERELDGLVATTVIEVGVDVPNATIMIVQEADRFGLAQLHQLRG